MKKIICLSLRREKGFREFNTIGLMITLSLFIGGCSAMPVSETRRTVERSMIDVQTIQTGMSRSQVEHELGDKVTTGYEIMNPALSQETDPKSPSAKPITVKNSLRVELYRANEKVYEAAFYFVSLKQQDGVITDDELMPFVFEDDKLIGKGWEFYRNFKKEFQL